MDYLDNPYVKKQPQTLEKQAKYIRNTSEVATFQGQSL